MKALAARAVEVVNPMLTLPVDATPIFAESAAVPKVKEVTATVLPIFGRTPVVVDAASRVTPLLVV
jgi:hypothetical protein